MSILPSLANGGCSVLAARNKQAHVILQIVRWRKPKVLNLPRGKSKSYVLKEKKPFHPEETPLLQEWFNHYRTEMKSVRSFVCQNLYMKQDPKVLHDGKAGGKQMKDDWKEMIRKNQAWNDEVAVQRKADERKKYLIMKKVKSIALMRDQQEREELIAAARLKVEHLIGTSKDFVTEENIDQKVEEMLNTITKYDFHLTKTKVSKFHPFTTSLIDGNIVTTDTNENISSDGETQAVSEESDKNFDEYVNLCEDTYYGYDEVDIKDVPNLGKEEKPK